MPGKTCPDCGGALARSTWPDGDVWLCASHGVRDWLFEEPTLLGGPQVDVVAPRPDERRVR